MDELENSMLHDIARRAFGLSSLNVNDGHKETVRRILDTAYKNGYIDLVTDVCAQDIKFRARNPNI